MRETVCSMDSMVLAQVLTCYNARSIHEQSTNLRPLHAKNQIAVFLANP
jgi:hypothetical protein